MERILNLVFVVLIFSCATSQPEREKLSDMKVPYTGTEIEMEIPSLKDIYSDYFVIGASIEPFQIIGAEGALLSKHFSGITAENVMKQLSVHPEEGKYTFGPADQLLEYAKVNNMKVRGHTLVWHHPYQTAKWMFKDKEGNPASRELMLERLRDHIHTVVGRNKGQIYAWDVVNEAIDISEKDNLRHTDWYNLIGPDYIAKAFEYAHEADPDALLFLNDYGAYNEQKGEALFVLAKKLKHSGVPIHGLGLQFHITLTHPRMDAIEQMILKMRTLGLQLHITELDMSLYSHEYEILDSAPHDYLVRQAYRYKELFDLFKIHYDVIGNVTFWGYHDGHSWLNTKDKPNWPFLFDKEYKAKYAYWALVDTTQLPKDIQIPLVERKPKIYSAPQGTPIIDGEIDEIWAAADWSETSVFVMPNAGASANVKVLWDPQHIYVLADISDELLSNKSANNYEHDSFEIFLDEDNAKAESYQADDYQFRINFENVRSYGGYAKASLIQSETIVTDTGYRIEAIINLQTMEAAVGSVLGVDFQVNDDVEGNGKRGSMAKWNDSTNESWRNTSGWGILKLVE